MKLVFPRHSKGILELHNLLPFAIRQTLSTVSGAANILRLT